MIAFIKSHWLFFLVVSCSLAVFLAGHFSGANSKAYNMLLDTLRADQSRVVKVLSDSLSQSEQEIAALQDAKAQLQKEKATLQKKADESSAKVIQLNGEIDALNKKYKDYIAPSDPAAIIDDLRKLGIGPIRLN
jgi:peptidoglycan hydrolase CwlO-like protein